MSEFSLTTVFVLPVGNALPASGSTQNLIAGKFGVFKDDARTIATSGNIATANYIQFFQGHDATIGAVIGSKPSDKIKLSKVKNFYKVTGTNTANVQITTLSTFTAECGEDLTLTLRAHSSYIDMLAFNGLTRSVTIKTPCCACGVSPCTVVDNEAVVDLFMAKLAQTTIQVGAESLNIGTFFTFTKTGATTTAALVITGKPLTQYGQPCDVSANPYQYDRMWFRTFVTEGPATTADFQVFDACDTTAVVTVTQRSSYPRLTSKEVKQMEINYFSYQSPFKHLFTTSGYNQYFETFVTDGIVYDQYVIQFDELLQESAWTANQKQDERVILYIPQGEGAVIETMLTAYIGAPTNETGGTITTSPVTP